MVIGCRGDSFILQTEAELYAFKELSEVPSAILRVPERVLATVRGLRAINHGFDSMPMESILYDSQKVAARIYCVLFNAHKFEVVLLGIDPPNVNRSASG